MVVASPHTDRLKRLGRITVIRDNREAVRKADIVIFAVKPRVLLSVLAEVKDSLKKDALLVSIAAGISIQRIEKAVGGKRGVVRVMPNLCAKIGESMSVWVANERAAKSYRSEVRKILGSIGVEHELSSERLIDGATAISGSGPAYVFYLAELLAANAEKLGLSKEVAQKLAVQTIVGSGLMLQEGTVPSELRAGVTSKGGTTEAAFKAFVQGGFSRIFSKGIEAAVKRAKELDK